MGLRQEGQARRERGLRAASLRAEGWWALLFLYGRGGGECCGCGATGWCGVGVGLGFGCFFWSKLAAG